MNLLIVCNQMEQAQILSQGIDWEKSGIHQLFTASTYQNALEVCEAALPDIIICNSELPNAEGIGVIKWGRRHAPDTCLCNLIPNNHHALLKSSAKVGTYHQYLFFPAQKKEWEEKLYCISRHVVAQQQDESTFIRYGSAYEKNLHIYLELFWRDLLTNIIVPAKEEILEVAKSRMIPIDFDSYQIECL